MPPQFVHPAFFQFQAHIGSGGFGTVERHIHLPTGQHVALKRMRQSFTYEEAVRFQREIEETAKLDHPNIVQVLYYNLTDPAPFYVMPYCSHGNLRSTLNQLVNKSMPVHAAKLVMTFTARALAHAHEKGVIHRDIKPDNILFNDTWQPVICDWGIGRFLHRHSANRNAPLTQGPMGTPGYAAPEQVANTDVDHRADVFALGVMYLEMLTGNRDLNLISNAPGTEQALIRHMTRPKRDHRPSMVEVLQSLHTGEVKDPVTEFWKIAGAAAVVGGLLFIAAAD